MDKEEKNSSKTLESIKWTISRIDSFHEIMANELGKAQKYYEDFNTKSNAKLKEYRNYILSAIGITLVIILGYGEVYELEQWMFFGFLIPTLIIGFLIFITFNRLSGKIDALFYQLAYLVNKQEQYLRHSQGFITTGVALIETVNYEFVKNYLLFSTLLTSAIMNNVANNMIIISKKNFYSKEVATALQSESRIYKKSIDEKSIRILLQTLDRTQPLPPLVVEFVDEALKEYQTK